MEPGRGNGNAFCVDRRVWGVGKGSGGDVPEGVAEDGAGVAGVEGFDVVGCGICEGVF